MRASSSRDTFATSPGSALSSASASRRTVAAATAFFAVIVTSARARSTAATADSGSTLAGRERGRACLTGCADLRARAARGDPEGVFAARGGAWTCFAGRFFVAAIIYQVSESERSRRTGSPPDLAAR